MPFKFHEPRRYRVPKARYRVRNWAEYDRGLVARGDVRVWISAEAIKVGKQLAERRLAGSTAFPIWRSKRCWVLSGVYRLRLRQCEGFVRSLIELMRLDLKVPDHTTLARQRRTVETPDFRWLRKGPIDIVID